MKAQTQVLKLLLSQSDRARKDVVEQLKSSNLERERCTTQLVVAEAIMKQALLDSDIAKTKMMQLFTSIELLGDLKLKLDKNDIECQIQTE